MNDDKSKPEICGKYFQQNFEEARTWFKNVIGVYGCLLP
jgi:hypothetical protein